MGFTIPPKSMPRDRWRAEPVSRPDSRWPQVEVLVHGPDGQQYSYDRNYSFLRTFEPFRQLGPDGWHEYALVSRSYTKTAVLDLSNGEIVAEEETTQGGHGFCPVEFYVPDWWEPDAWGEQDDSIKPGDELWEPYMEARCGNLGFVAGCVWGDDSGWKIQQLDLSKIDQGLITRSSPYGYVELAPGVALRDAVEVDFETQRISIAVSATFSMKTGELCDWSLEGLNRAGTATSRDSLERTDNGR